MNNTRLQQLAGIRSLHEKYEDYTEEQLIDELWGQLQNLQYFIPESREQFRKELNSGHRDTYIQTARNIIEAASKIRIE